MHAVYMLAIRIFITIIFQRHFSTSTNCMGHKIMYLRFLPASHQPFFPQTFFIEQSMCKTTINR